MFLSGALMMTKSNAIVFLSLIYFKNLMRFWFCDEVGSYKLSFLFINDYLSSASLKILNLSSDVFSYFENAIKIFNKNY